MILTSLRTSEVLQVCFCYINVTMPHFTRKLKKITPTVQVHLCKRMTKHVGRKLDILKTAQFLNTLNNRMNSTWMKRLTLANKKSSLSRVIRFTVLMDILPKKLTHFWVDTYLPFLTTFAHNLNIAIVHIRNMQTANFSYTHTRIEQKQQDHMIPKAYRSTSITNSKHLFNMFSSKRRPYTLWCFRMLQTSSRVNIY